MKVIVVALSALMLAAAVAPCGADPAGPQFYRPLVPVSAFARSPSWLDASRLHMTTSVMVGSGFGSGGAQGLQVTSFAYQLGAPLAMRMSLGNAFGAQAAGSGRMFLEGLDLTYRPFSSMSVQFHYQDIRSPLQLSRTGGYGSSDLWR